MRERETDGPERQESDERDLYALFAEASGLTGNARERFLGEIEASDPELAANLRELLAVDEREGVVPAEPSGDRWSPAARALSAKAVPVTSFLLRDADRPADMPTQGEAR